jgi:hypothetical protein
LAMKDERSSKSVMILQGVVVKDEETLEDGQ